MRDRTVVARLVWLARWRTSGVRGYVSGAVVLALVNIFVLSGVFDSGTLTLGTVVSWGPYFVAVAAFVAAAGLWEVELHSSLVPWYQNRPVVAVGSRALGATFEVCPVVIAFILAGLWTQADGCTLIALGVIAASWVLLGAVLPLALGMRGDKSINNLVQAVPWVLALGPGPFFRDQVHAWTVMFPGGSGPENIGAELIRAAVILSVCLAMLLWCSRPRRRPAYEP